ncbi:unnamed protein product [Bursaphelenchus okinawaensis]|uniref:Uncharacterized protein n=1 Tax=Bursaphelenchus okinawaensis TaxID=465554 RepID=A0A811LNU1_9BILA|nr:unnamed protein product [Bursaphelenchus okinawaensis]CAG9124636.1 unnamed protein product [Bursaphelenchus okinawaensis]
MVERMNSTEMLVILLSTIILVISYLFNCAKKKSAEKGAAKCSPGGTPIKQDPNALDTKTAVAKVDENGKNDAGKSTVKPTTKKDEASGGGALLPTDSGYQVEASGPSLAASFAQPKTEKK